MKPLRSPIVVLLAHVDHGKTSILDKIRGTAVAAGEAGGITQAIGASIIPVETLKKVCGPLLSGRTELKIPGLLFIDSPGHEAFTNLRKRGGNLADMAILVIDINEGIMPQTKESIEILKQYRTPFLIAANKLDLLPGWQVKDAVLIKSISMQAGDVQKRLDTKLYGLVGKLAELGFNADRFDRITDYTKNIAIIPVSAKTGEGIPEVLMVLAGLAQRYLAERITCEVGQRAKGTILELKEQEGIGCCIDTIIYDGHLSVGDTIVMGTLGEPVVTKVRALLEPQQLAEMRDRRSKFLHVKAVHAATGVRIVAPLCDEAIAGMPVHSCSPEDVDKERAAIQKEIAEVILETDENGIVVKADNLGSLEAVLKMLRGKNVPIRKASIGSISKKDIIDAKANLEKEPLHAVVVGFNVPATGTEIGKDVKVITNTVIYKLIDDLLDWQKEREEQMRAKGLDRLQRPAKIELLKGYVFRQNNPAVIGCEVLAGVLQLGMPLMKDGKRLTEIRSMQMDRESVRSAEKGQQLALAMPGVSVGKQIAEGDILYTFMSEENFRSLKDFKQFLSADEKAILNEIAEIMRRENAVWGV